MRSRRHYLSALVGSIVSAFVAGCTSDDGGPTETQTPVHSPTPTQTPDTTPGERDIINTTIDSPKETKDDLLVNVPSILIDNEAIVWGDADFGGGEQELSTNTEEMVVLVDFYAENIGDEPQDLPDQRNIHLIIEGDQYSPEYVNVDEVREPVEGPCYQQLRDARSGVSEEGYIVYKTKRHDGDIDVSWWPDQLTHDLEEINWSGEVDGSELPAIELTDIQIPESTQVGIVTVELSWHNSGGQQGEAVVPVSVDWPGGWEDEGDFSVTVPGEETVTEEFDLITNALGTTKVYIDGEEYAIEVTPREFSFGDGSELPYVPQIVAEEPIFSDHITMDTWDPEPEYAEDGHEFAVFSVLMQNDGEESLERPCRDNFDLVVDGQSHTPYDTGFTSDMLEPLEMEELSSCYGTRTIDPGSEVEGAIAFEIPIDRSELVLEAQWSFSGWDAPDTGLIWRE